jgi:tricorn protease
MSMRIHGLILALVFVVGLSHGAPLPPPDPERPLWLRTPAVSPDGSRMAFAHGGQIWVVPTAGGEASALTSGPFYSHHPVWSPDGQRIAFASRRHGNDDVFIMSVEGGAITRLTFHSAADVPQAFSPDGREILFASARRGSPQADAVDVAKPLGGLQQLYAVPVAGGRPTLLLPTPALDVAPSADGQRLLYTDSRSFENEWRKHHVSEAARDVWLYDRRDGSHRRLSDFRGEDRNAVWSPQEEAVLWLSERSGSFNVWRQPLAGGVPQQITFHQGQPVRFLSSARDGSLVYGYAGEIWRLPAGATQPLRVPVRIRQGNLMPGPTNVKLAGQAVLLASDRAASPAPDGNPIGMDVYATFLTPEAFEAFGASAGERTGLAQAAGGAPVFGPPDLRGIERRTLRLTPFTVDLQFYRLTPDGRSLLLVAADPVGKDIGYAIDLASGQPRVLFQRPRGATTMYEVDAKGETVLALGAAGIDRYDVATGKAVGSVPFDTEMTRDAQAEIAAMFDHAWRLTKVKFYDARMHGVDWDQVGAEYRRYLPYVQQWEELVEILSAMVGELNASHQGSYFTPSGGDRDATASLGVYLDEGWRGAGVRVVEVLAGGPADRSRSVLKPGAVILAVDGQPITPETELAQLLNRKAGQPVRLSVRPAQGGEPVEETLTPVGLQQEFMLAYQRWVDKRRAQVEKASGGRIGYLHIPHMAMPEYLSAYGDLFGRYRQTEAVLVDVRFNRGGNLHDPLVVMLTGQRVAELITRDGVPIAEIPVSRWTRPSALIANAGSYSDGSVFPALYKQLKIGPLLGESVPGTGTAVWWEKLLDRRLEYGVPQLGFKGRDGRFFENQEIVPDVPVAADPAALAAGRDPQLERGVDLLQQQIAPRPLKSDR